LSKTKAALKQFEFPGNARDLPHIPKLPPAEAADAAPREPSKQGDRPVSPDENRRDLLPHNVDVTLDEDRVEEDRRGISDRHHSEDSPRRHPWEPDSFLPSDRRPLGYNGRFHYYDSPRGL
jgi:hypothetical protein